MILGIAFIGLPSLHLTADDKESVSEEMIERRQKVELMGFFLKDPQDAAMPGTTLSIQLLNQAIEYYQKNEYELAKQAAQDSLKHDSQNAFAYELLGDIYNNQQNLKEAKIQYDIAYNLQPREGLRGKMEKLGTETQVDKKLSTYREEHFIIKYQNQDRGIEGFELRELLRQTYRDISRDLGYYFRGQIVVLLYDEGDFKKIAGSPHWAAGLYDGKVRMPLKRFSYNDKQLRALTAHEVTHAFVAALSSQRAPAWINEGLAQVEQNKVEKIDMLVFDSAVKTRTLLPLDQLISEQALQGKSDALWVGLFYQQSFHLTQYLVDRYGTVNLKKMLLEFAQGKNSDEVIRAVLQISTARLEKEWRATFTK